MMNEKLSLKTCGIQRQGGPKQELKGVNVVWFQMKPPDASASDPLAASDTLEHYGLE